MKNKIIAIVTNLIICAVITVTALVGFFGAGAVTVSDNDSNVYYRSQSESEVCLMFNVYQNTDEVYEILDLNIGKCRIAVAGKVGFKDDPSLALRVATKYPHIAKKYYDSLGRKIDIIELHGSIELAPILDMSDVIVDIVETGATLKENDLCVYSVIGESSARLIANKSAYNLGGDMIRSIAAKLEAL
mgnify:CR=1 FL=1